MSTPAQNGAACATTHYDSSLACTAGIAGDEQASGGAETEAALFTGCWASDKGHDVQIQKMLKQLDGFIRPG